MPAGDRPPPDEILRQFEAAIKGMGLDDLRAVADRILAEAGSHPSPPAPMRSMRKARRDDPVTYRIRVDLDHAKPPMWRRLDVRSDLTLDRMHQVLQAAFGWLDMHLHRFALGGDVFDRNAELFLCPFDVEEGDTDGVPEHEVRLDETLAEPGDVLHYCYDYGDDWSLTIRLESVHPASEQQPAAVCVDGRRAAPPEDCGGLRDAESLADVLENPARFDPAEVNQALNEPFAQLTEHRVHPELLSIVVRLSGTTIGAQLATVLQTLTSPDPVEPTDEQRSAALHPVLWFLRRVGEKGLPLTSAGYLKPADVKATAAVLPGAREWIGKHNRESQTLPVLDFRQAVQRLGLARRDRGRLLLTKAGAAAVTDTAALWRQLAQRLVPDAPGSFECHVTVLCLAYAAAGNGTLPFATVADALTEYGWRAAEGGRRTGVDQYAVQETFAERYSILRNMGTGDGEDRGAWPPSLSPTARVLAREALVPR